MIASIIVAAVCYVILGSVCFGLRNIAVLTGAALILFMTVGIPAVMIKVLFFL